VKGEEIARGELRLAGVVDSGQLTMDSEEEK
jgi:hypothetical protein